MLALAFLAAMTTSSPSPTPAPTPNPYRSLHFGTPSLEPQAVGDVAVLGGWVAVRRDGKGAHACISFKNQSPKTATRVVFEFPIIDRSGEHVAKMTLDRRGTFSSGVDINGWSSLQNWQSGSNRGYDENCTGLKLSLAAFPLLAAHSATYRVLRVEYSDGTSWSATR